ncbi:MAG: hypothetical protein CMF22_10280 [Idiomarinaceae bacterium]|nr:hypothetical protein [Idiomarinaceae bacterium]MBG23829.1 hypothetical protein [Idiomarinaceae bacterium]|tara:strand:- start:32929 stop:33159 length:231 start_codon:yes stop_codon:yes gene_type:complete
MIYCPMCDEECDYMDSVYSIEDYHDPYTGDTRFYVDETPMCEDCMMDSYMGGWSYVTWDEAQEKLEKIREKINGLS